MEHKSGRLPSHAECSSVTAKLMGGLHTLNAAVRRPWEAKHIVNFTRHVRQCPTAIGLAVSGRPGKFDICVALGTSAQGMVSPPRRHAIFNPGAGGRRRKFLEPETEDVRWLLGASVDGLFSSAAISAQCSSMTATRAYAIPLPMFHFDTPPHHNFFILNNRMNTRN